MDANELRAAAKRYRTYGLASRSPTSPYAEDVRVLADAYLDEHPADDVEPVTEDWLRAVGFKTCAHWGAMNIGNWHDAMAVEWDGGKWRLTACRRGGGCDFDYDIPPLTTRGHVRRLCAALGIDLHETTPGGAA